MTTMQEINDRFAPPDQSPGGILTEAGATFRRKSAEYGDNYKRIGGLLSAMIPEGLEIQSSRDWNRFHLLLMILVKVTRYTENWSRGGHADSLRDLAVYAAMLESLDADNKEKP